MTQFPRAAAATAQPVRPATPRTRGRPVAQALHEQIA